MGKRNDADAKAEAFAIAERRTKVAELYLRGHRQSDIATQLDVCGGTISRDLAAIHAEWQAARVAFLDEATDRELQKLDMLEREAWEAWERSKEKQQINKIRTRTGQTGQTSIQLGEVVTTSRDGNPRFLLVIDACMQRRAKLMGLDKPIKVANTDSDGNDIISPEQARLGLLAIIAQLRERERIRNNSALLIDVDGAGDDVQPG